MKGITSLTLSLGLVLASFGHGASHSHSHDGPAHASHTAEHSGLKIEHPWARTSPPGAPSAGFMTVQNGTDEDDVLLAVEGDFAKRLELHRSFMADGVMKMQHQKDGIVIPAGEAVVFEPGGYHLMFMGLNKRFEQGEQYSVTLRFETAGDITLELPVMDTAKHDHSHSMNH